LSKLVARIFGGLGNQLFCYATARRLSLINNLTLKLDINSGFQYDFYYQRKYLLSHFNIKADIANRRESFNYPGGRLIRFFVKRINKLLPLQHHFYLQEQSIFNFDTRMLRLRPRFSLTIEGYWHSERYFKDIGGVRVKTGFV